MAREIGDHEITEADLPLPEADEETVWKFAQTFDGFRHVETWLSD